jgi:phosphoadenosine phosphosulfate reductase
MKEQNRIEQERAMQRSRPLSEKIEESKRILRLAADMSKEYYGKPLMLSYSGGKDSSVLLHLAETTLGTDEFEVQTSHTSLDAPETVYFYRKEFKRLNEKGVKTTVHMPKDKNGNHLTMWNLIVMKQTLPTRVRRVCCEYLKENSTPNRLTALGVRESESAGRQGRDIFVTNATNFKKQRYFSYEHAEEVFQESQEIQDENWDCQMITDMKKKGNALVNAIYWWSDNDVWDYIHQENIEVNPLYEKYGLKRIGCIGCPMTSISQIKREFELYPKYEMAYKNAIKKMLEARKASGKGDLGGKWKDVDSTFDWWLKKSKYEVEGQMSLFEEE